MGVKNPHLTSPNWGDRVADIVGSIPELPGALCTQYDPDLFFPERGERDKAEQAREVCARCPVAAACLTDALKAEGGNSHSYRHGIRGGKSPNQRYQLYLLSRESAPAEEIATPAAAEQESKREPVECGTRRGYQWHRRNGENACDACRFANAAADRRLRTHGTTKVVAA